MADYMKMIAQAQQMQERLQEIQDQLAHQTVVATSGGGMVTVTATGQGQVMAIKVDRAVINTDDVEMLEDLLLVAVADAQKKAAELAQEEMKKLTGGLPFKLPF
ncbi:MAG: YbaB/EbfC family nucleoid-associated protein [Gemmatimonadaceae bacterium]